jgi:hypothetical protein
MTFNVDEVFTKAAACLADEALSRGKCGTSRLIEAGRTPARAASASGGY